MRKLFFYISIAAVVIFTNEVMAQKTVINEFYYEVNEKGEVNKTSILEEQIFVHHPGKGFILTYNSQVPFRKGKARTESNKYYKLPDPNKDDNHCKYDEHNRIIEYCEYPKEDLTIRHFYTYNDQGDLSEDKYTVTNNNGECSPAVTLCYDYLYLKDFTFNGFTYIEAGGKKFIAGIKPNDNNNWIKRSVKKDGLLVQYTERKIRQPK